METISPTEQARDGLAIENAIFETVIQLGDMKLREDFLARVYPDDVEARERMKEMIGLTGNSSAFFLQGRLSRASLAEEILGDRPEEVRPVRPFAMEDSFWEGVRIDRYTLVRKIGEGGSSLVFEARQDGMERAVAIKVIRSGMDSARVLARFDAERRALEMMEHPNIARALDSGNTDEGHPYFVMELVRGRKVTDFCKEEKLPLEERIGIFLKVCQAIQHAHQKGIIHRDIKPSNILVERLDGAFVPKVIDFGIAKAIHNQSASSGMTLHDQFLGTPAYMSPEQVDMGGLDIDTRADIYSLGVLLYELLTGRQPFDTARLLQSGIIEMRRVILEDMPPRPSAMVADNRAVGRRAASFLREDIDWIILKAMEKDRNRRYLTVNSLAMDLRRFLANEPVIARRPGRGYLVKKFFLRNRAACVLGTFALISLLAGLASATSLYLRERDAVAQQERLKHEAETARMKENRMRRQAQARANVSRAALLLSEGNVEEADQLLQENPLASVEPWSEAARVFRSVGRWNAVLGRWQQALDCFQLMNQANRSNPSDSIEGLDLLMTAPTFLEAGDQAGYLAFRKQVIDEHQDVSNALQAEHILKVCLLTPADDALLARLPQAAATCEAYNRSPSGRHAFPEWNALSLSLYYYRKGDMELALDWAETCISYTDHVGSRRTAALCVLAMAQIRLGAVADARSAMDQVAQDLRELEARVNESGYPDGSNWFAWSVTRILLREARSMLVERA